MAGDNDLDAEGEHDLTQMKSVDTGGRVQIAVQFDRAEAGRNTRRYLLRHGSSLVSDVVDNLGETNTGDPSVLENFLLWGFREYPAKHFMVVIWNHGGGVDDTDHFAAPAGVGGVRRAGGMRLAPGRLRQRSLFAAAHPRSTGGKRRKIAVDNGARDFLDNIELKKVLVNARAALGRPIDILGMDACLMSMVEIAWQVRDSVSFLVGSQENEPGTGWPYDTILAQLATRPDMTPAELSGTVVERYLAHYPPDAAVTQSACDVSKLPAVHAALDQLAGTLLARLDERPFAEAVLTARQQARQFAHSDYVDLHDLCACLSARAGDAEVTAAGTSVQRALAKAITSGAGAGLPNTHGLSIYFPLMARSPLYAALDFAAPDCRWAAFLESFVPPLLGS